MARLEHRAIGDLAMYWRAGGHAANALSWTARCGPAKFRLPPKGQDGSYNFAPCLLAGAGEWDKLDKVLETYWKRGCGNEFNSPLYGARVLTAAALRAFLGPRDADAQELLENWAAFLALQAIFVHRHRKHQVIRWAGADMKIGCTLRNGVMVPSAGLRLNTAFAVETQFAPVLAKLAGIGNTHHRIPRAWRNWLPPETPKQWRPSGPRSNMASPWGLAQMLGTAMVNSNRRLGVSLYRTIRNAVCGNCDESRLVLYRKVRRWVVIPRQFEKFVIDRYPWGVATWWQGKAGTRQKPSVAAAAIRGRFDENGVLHHPTTEVLVTSRFKIPTTATTAWRKGRTVVAVGDVKDVLKMKGDPVQRFVFENRAS